MKKKCAKCNATFECQMDDIKNCHCSNVVLSKSELDVLRDKYDNCLCNECLKDLAKEQKE